MIPGGVRNYIENLVLALALASPESQYYFYYRNLRRPGRLPAVPRGTRMEPIYARVPRRLFSYLENHLGWPPIEYWQPKLDVVHGTHFTLPLTRRARSVLTVHDVAFLREPRFYRNRRLNEYGYRYLLGHSLARADLVLASSHSTKRDLIELCRVKEEKIWVVPIGRDERFRRVPADEARPVLDRYGITRPFALYPAGTFEARKNVENTLKAFARAFGGDPDRPLFFLSAVGDPPAELKSLVDHLGLRDDFLAARVEYPGELMALMSTATWGMYPSLYEGFGLPPLEAMSCGLPLMVSRVSSVPEVVGDAALIVDPASVEELSGAMRKLQESENLRMALSRRGLLRASGPAFSWARAARQTLAAYRDDLAAYRLEPQPMEEVPPGASFPMTPASV